MHILRVVEYFIKTRCSVTNDVIAVRRDGGGGTGAFAPGGTFQGAAF